MNKRKMEDSIHKAIEAMEEKVNYIAYCPICEGLASVINETEEFIYMDCFNSVCPMGTYILRREKLETESVYVSKELSDKMQELKKTGESIEGN